MPKKMPSKKEDSKKEESVTISKNALFGIVAGVLVLLLVASIFTGGFGLFQAPADTTGGTHGGTTTGGTDTGTGTSGTSGTTGTTTPRLQTIQVDGGSLPPLGDADAPVSFIEFSDFQCPFCGRFYSQTEDALISNYIDTGKVKFYYRDYPLLQLGHRNADDTAYAARCANDQGKFWEYHNLIFDRQNSWSNLGDDTITATLVGYAEELNLDTARFESCLTTKEHQNAVGEDIADGQTAAGQSLGTPTFFILIPKDKVSLDELTGSLSSSPYGQYISLAQTDDSYAVIITGALPYDAFTTVLDAVNY